MVAKWLANVWWPLDSIAISVFCNFGWVWQILNEKQIQIPIWWGGELQPCVIHNVYWPLHGNEKWDAPNKKRSKGGEWRSTGGAWGNVQSCEPEIAQDAQMSASSFNSLLYSMCWSYIDAWWRSVPSVYCDSRDKSIRISEAPPPIPLLHPMIWSIMTSGHWPPTHHRFGKFHLIFPVLEIENTAYYCQIH